MEALFALVFLAATFLGIIVFRPIMRYWIGADHRTNDMVGFALSSFSVLYGLLLGLLAIASFQNFSLASDNVDKEASSLAALYRGLSGYPQPIRGQLKEKLRNYTHELIERAWPLQRHGVVPVSGSDLVTKFFQNLSAFKPSEKKEEIIHAETLEQFNHFVELRRSRLSNVTIGIPVILWWVVAIGAFLNIVLICMLDMEVHLHMLIGGLLLAFLGVVIFLIAVMDNPFRGKAVGPDPFQLVYNSLMKPTEN